MSEKQWALFFELMTKAVHLPDLSSDEKAQQIAEKAKEHNTDGDLAEFVGMYGGEVDEDDTDGDDE